MGWTITDALDLFTAEAGEFLELRPVEHSVPRTVCGRLRRCGLDAYGEQPPFFGWWRPDGGGEVAAVCLRTPPFPPLLTRGTQEAARALAYVLDGPLPGVRGDAESVRAFGEAWQRRTGAGLRVEREMRVYRLGALTPRTPAPPGGPRAAGPADRALLLRWHEDFARDIGESNPSAERVLDDALTYGGRTLWEVDGEPVAMAGGTAPEDGAVRVVAVFTPAERRGRGYAGAAVTAVARAALDAGARDVLLVADLANPASNHLYQRLGFVPVRDQLAVAFTGTAGAPPHA
jgi:GNAT superfamily N-acetyltransferase